jgi:nucleoside-diphosphate-sugar epimerase
MSKSLAVIVGAGPVGLTAARQFRDRGFAVRIVTRSGLSVEGAETVAADAADPAGLTKAAAGASVILHSAGAPYHRWYRDLPCLQDAILAAAEHTGAVAVFVENLYSYTADAMPLTESSEERPRTQKGALRLALSRQWIEAHASGRVRAVSVRAADYFGPGSTRSPNSPFGSRFFPALEQGKPVAFLGNPEARHCLTYLPDFARALVDVSLDPEAWGRPWIAPSLSPVSMGEVARRFAAEAGVSVKVGALPKLLIRLLGLVNPVIREIGEMLPQFEKDFVVDASAWKQRFGWEATDLVRAVKETWDDHRASR